MLIIKISLPKFSFGILITIDLIKDPSLVDGGATHSILTYPFHGVKRKNIPVNTAGDPITALGDGDTSIIVEGLNKRLKLSGALYVPTATKNIISESDFINDGYAIIHNRKGKFIADDNDTLYEWLKEFKLLECKQFDNNLFGVNVIDENIRHIGNLYRRRTDINSEAYFDLYTKLHNQFGHPGHRLLVEITKPGNTSDQKKIITGIPPNFRCETCDRNKGKHKPYVSKKNIEKISRLHTDVTGPFDPPTKEGYRYAQIIVNELTKEPILRLLKKKSHAINELIDVINLHDNQNIDSKIQAVRFDNGELKSKAFTKWCELKGIVEEPTIPFEKQSNGTAEQHIYLTKTKARCMLDDSKLPNQFWGWAMKHAAYVRSLTPTTEFKKSPFELRTSHPPETEFLKPFGSLVYVFTPKEKRQHSIATHVREKKIYIGAFGKAHIEVADPSSLKVTRHRYADCKFYPDIFPRANVSNNDPKWDLIAEDPSVTTNLEKDITENLKLHLEMKMLAASPEARRLLPNKNQAHKNDVPVVLLPNIPKNLQIDMTDKMMLDKIFNDTTNNIGGRTRSKRKLAAESDNTVPRLDGLTDSPSPGAGAQADTSGDVDDAVEEDTLSLPNNSDKGSPIVVTDSVKGANMQNVNVTELEQALGTTDNNDKKRKRRDKIVKKLKSIIKECRIPYVKLKQNVAFSDGNYNNEEISIFNYENEINMITRKSWHMRPAAEILAEVHTIVSELDSEIPKTWKQVLTHPYKLYWIEAMKKEIDSLVTKKVWVITDKPQDGRKLIGCRWVFALKKKANGEIERYKARLVAQGYSQEEGIDYDDIYSPVIRQATLRYILSFCLAEGLDVELADIETAFLYGDIDKILFMKNPPGDLYSVPRDKCLKLLKAIYGLKQAGRQWFVRLSDYLKRHGFIQGKFDKCIFIKRWTKEKDGFNDVAIIGIYVDDIIIGGSKRSINEVKKLIFAEFKGKALGKIAYMLGIIMDWKEDDKELYLHQRKYILEVLKKFRMDDDNVRIASIPIQPNINLYGPRREDEEPLSKTLPYRSAIGALFYLLVTRPDISFAMSVLSQHCENPTMRHWKGVLQVMRYLKGTLNLGLKLTNERGNRFTAYSDASYNLHHDAKGQGGYIIYHNGNPISYWSGKQRVNGLSSTDDEIFALNECVRELKALVYTSDDLKKRVELPINVYVDSQPCIKAMETGKRSKRNKHLEPRLFYTHELIEDGFIKLNYVNTKEQAADILTKALGPKDFIYLRDEYYMTKMK